MALWMAASAFALLAMTALDRFVASRLEAAMGTG